MYFQSSSKWVLRFRIYDTRCLHLSNCRSLFWSDRVTLVILRKFLTEVFSAIVQMYFQSFSGSFIGFKANYTLYLRFCWISNWSNFRSQFRSNHTTLVRLWLFFFFETTFSLLSCRCTFKSALNGFYELDSMKHGVYFFAEYKTGAIANHCFEVVPWL